ncbi:MAG: YkvA family protein [Solirubrobacterales bacterium]
MKPNQQEQSLLKEIVLFVPNLVTLMGRLIADSRVALAEKAILVATIAYVVSPLDFLPDLIPGIGMLDDLMLMSLVTLRFLEQAGPNLVNEHWNGRMDLMDLFKKALSLAGVFLPRSVYDRVVKKSGYRDGAIDVEYKVHKT